MVLSIPNPQTQNASHTGTETATAPYFAPLVCGGRPVGALHCFSSSEIYNGVKLDPDLQISPERNG
jgi:hypothetical protein